VSLIAPQAESGDVAGQETADAPFERGPEVLERWVARVLDRAHRKAHAHKDPAAARTILHVAHSFADEMATVDPQFDRLRFIKDATRDSS